MAGCLGHKALGAIINTHAHRALIDGLGLETPHRRRGRGRGGPVNITCVQYLLIQQFYAIHFAIHLVLPVVCDRERFLVVFECRDSDQS